MTVTDTINSNEITNEAPKNDHVSSPPPKTNSKLNILNHIKNPLLRKLIPIFTAILLIIILSTVLITQLFRKTIKPGSFTECQLASGSQIDPNNPGRCITSGGEEFINPSIKPSPFAASPTDSVPFDWKDYSNNELGFSLRYPSTWKDPVVSIKGKLTSIQFNSTMLIEDGIYTFSGIEYSYNQYVEKNRSPDRTVIDYSLAGVQGKRFYYEQGNSLAETLIALPRSKEKEIFTLSYKAYPSDTEAQKILYQILGSLNFGPIQTTTPIPNTAEAIIKEGCKISGCNKAICQDKEEEDIMSTCIYKPEFACYKTITCEKQDNGKCGWTETEEFKKCISNARSSTTDTPQ